MSGFTQGSLAEGQRHLADQVRTIALEQVVLGHLEDDQQIPPLFAKQEDQHAPGLPAADAHAIVDAAWNIDFDFHPGTVPMSTATALGALVRHDFATATAGIAGHLHGEEAAPLEQDAMTLAASTASSVVSRAWHPTPCRSGTVRSESRSP